MSLPAGADLGATNDPKALILGEPSSLEEAADSLRREAATMETIGDNLKAVRIPSWTGSASDAFWQNFDSEPRVWFQVHDIMTKAARAMSDQAGALRVAQNKAQDAIDKWNAGEAATKRAAASYEAEVLQRTTAMAQTPGLSLPIEPFHDPGEAMRQEAKQILADAQTELDKAGMEATSSLCDLGGVSWTRASGSASGPGASASAHGPGGPITYGNDHNLLDKRKAWQHPHPGDDKAAIAYSLGSVSAEAYVFKASGRVQGNYHGVNYAAQGDFKALDAHAGAGASISGGNIDGHIGAGADLLSASGKVHADAGPVSLDGQGNAAVGADANADASVGKDGVNMQGDAMAGAHADASGGFSIGGFGLEGTAEGDAGAGVAGGFGVDMKDGKIEIHADAGAALGLGGKVGGGITIDPAKVLDTGEHIVDGIGDLL